MRFRTDSGPMDARSYAAWRGMRNSRHATECLVPTIIILLLVCLLLLMLLLLLLLVFSLYPAARPLPRSGPRSILSANDNDHDDNNNDDTYDDDNKTNTLSFVTTPSFHDSDF